MITNLTESSRKDIVRGVALDQDGNVYITGETNGNLCGFTEAGNSDAFLIKYSPNTEIIWTKRITTPELDFGNAVVVGPDCFIYVTG